MAKLRVGILFGGRSGEHEVSLLSAASVLNAIDKTKYEVVPIGITKDGRWLTAEHAERLLKGNNEEQADKSVRSTQATQLRAGDPEATPGAAVLARGESVVVPPEPARREAGLAPFQTDANLRRAADRAINVDVIFPVLHGTFGEDGTIQGLLELADIAYVGAGVLGSSAGMDKDVMKSLFRASGLPIVKHVTLLRSQFEREPKKVQKLIEKKLRYPVFVKPANLGSSVGISKVRNARELPAALGMAAQYDRKILVEKGVQAREIECSVLGNDQPEASLPGEVVPVNEFYDYEAKYLKEGSELIIPAKLTARQTRQVRELAIRSFRAIDCAGMARVDFLLERKSGRIFVNEINTIPGFTPISMYPKLWEASGVPYAELIDRLIQLALERHQQKTRTRFTYEPRLPV